ncbi:MAG: hypothetical protein RLZZ385_320 [Pseudomonadota bacterium]|jgi:Ser/Thr protein kinase RdoA (MazF antagonist)
MQDSQHPYERLTPDLVLAAVESRGFVVDARQFPLNSYENRVYQVGVEQGPPWIVKFYRPQRWSDAQIQEEHDFTWRLHDLEIPVSPPWRCPKGATLHCFEEFRFAMFPRIRGRDADLEDPDNLQVMGRYLARIHLAGSGLAFRHRERLSVDARAAGARDFILQQGFMPAELLPAYESITADLLNRIRDSFAPLSKRGWQSIHGDCHLGNVLWQDGVPYFVDFDDTMTGPLMQDIWMLLSGNRDQRQAQLLEIAEGYNEFNDFPVAQLPLIESLRTLRIMHYAGWLARRWQDPAFPRHFPWFATPRYWSEHILELREQQAALDEEPLRLF